MWPIFIVMLVSLYIAYQWDHLPVIKESVSLVLDPIFGGILEWNIYVGLIVVVAFTSAILTLAQKFFSDQKELRVLKKEQKYLQEEMKKYKAHPEKLMELQKKQLEFIPKTFHLTMQPMIYTGIPVILLFRWFSEYFSAAFGNWWIAYYLIGAMIFSSIFRKLFNVA